MEDNLFVYSCKSCGYRLEFNKEKSVLTCPSCGNTYDYDYFMEGDLIKKASDALNAGEYISATSMYEFLLKKEPNNHKAIFGKFLSTHKFKSVNNITAKSFQSFPIDESFDEYKSHCSSEYVDFFDLAEKSVEIASRINEREAEIKELETSKENLDQEIKTLSSKSVALYTTVSNDYIDENYHPADYIKRQGIILLVIAAVIFLFMLIVSDWGIGVTLLALLIVVLIFGAIFAIIYSINKPALDAVRKYEAEIYKLERELKAVKNSLDEKKVDNKKDESQISQNILKMKQIYNS